MAEPIETQGIEVWSGYYAATRDRPPRPTCLQALAAFDGEPAPAGGARTAPDLAPPTAPDRAPPTAPDRAPRTAPDLAPRTALDLGCGIGRDTLAMLARGWRVVAIDAEAEALAELGRQTPPAQLPRLERRCADLATCPLPGADFVNASFVLPFLPLTDLLGLWARISAALPPGGRFAGHLLGRRDSWCLSGRCTGFDLAGLAGFVDGFSIESLAEEENDGVTPRGEAKHWHVWHLVLRRTAM